MQVYRQLSIFLENEPGTLARVCDALAQAGINIVAHSVSDSIDYAVFRCVVSDPVKSVHLLESAGTFVLEEDVLGLTLDDRPGSLGRIAEKLAAAKINIHYAYGSAPAGGPGPALLILRSSDLQKTREILA